MYIVLPVRTNFKNLSKETKSQLPTSTGLLLISVGQEAHEGDRFESTIHLINQYFSSCIVLLYDSLQRHTMALTSYKSPNEFHHTANCEGDSWLNRNQAYLDQLTIPHKISRWDIWLTHDSYKKQLSILEKSLEQDQSYGAIFNDTVTQYLDRYIKRVGADMSFDLDRARSICLQYLLEECTVLCLWLELDCEFEIYPNAHNRAMEATRAKFITPHSPHLLRSLNLRFRNAKQLAPQRFALLSKEDCTIHN